MLMKENKCNDIFYDSIIKTIVSLKLKYHVDNRLITHLHFYIELKGREMFYLLIKHLQFLYQ